MGAVWLAVKRAQAAGLDWAAVRGARRRELDARLYAREPSVGRARAAAGLRLDRHASGGGPGVTLELLHLEYLEQHPDGYRYTQFCELYRQWLGRQRLSMRQVHRAGEKIFVDYSGKKPRIWDAQTGELIDVELFVAVLGASNYTYAEATRTQRSRRLDREPRARARVLRRRHRRCRARPAAGAA